MLLVLQVLSVFLVAVSMGLALAHALESPGKHRLDAATYIAVQAIYYPGFTIGGIAEPLSAIVLVVLLLVRRQVELAATGIVAALAAIVTMHLVFWFITQPVNKYWLKNQRLGKAGAKFFDLQQSSSESDTPDWRRLRRRWEYSHIVRAALAAIALIALVIAIAV